MGSNTWVLRPRGMCIGLSAHLTRTEGFVSMIRHISQPILVRYQIMVSLVHCLFLPDQMTMHSLGLLRSRKLARIGLADENAHERRYIYEHFVCFRAEVNMILVQPPPAAPASSLVVNRNGTARSPTPPSRIIKSTYGGNLFTADDVLYLKKYIDYCRDQGLVLRYPKLLA